MPTKVPLDELHVPQLGGDRAHLADGRPGRLGHVDGPGDRAAALGHERDEDDEEQHGRHGGGALGVEEDGLLDHADGDGGAERDPEVLHLGDDGGGEGPEEQGRAEHAADGRPDDERPHDRGDGGQAGGDDPDVEVDPLDRDAEQPGPVGRLGRGPARATPRRVLAKKHASADGERRAR